MLLVSSMLGLFVPGVAAAQSDAPDCVAIVAEMLQPDRSWLRHVRSNDDDAALQHFRLLLVRDAEIPLDVAMRRLTLGQAARTTISK